MQLIIKSILFFILLYYFCENRSLHFSHTFHRPTWLNPVNSTWKPVYHHLEMCFVWLNHSERSNLGPGDILQSLCINYCYVLVYYLFTTILFYMFVLAKAHIIFTFIFKTLHHCPGTPTLKLNVLSLPLTICFVDWRIWFATQLTAHWLLLTLNWFKT